MHSSRERLKTISVRNSNFFFLTRKLIYERFVCQYRCTRRSEIGVRQDVGDATYSTASGVLQGWREHFSNLATPDQTTKCDHVYQELVRTEVPEIADICTLTTFYAPFALA